METVIVRPARVRTSAGGVIDLEGSQPMRDPVTAWLLDPIGLHREFNDLFAGLAEPDGLVRFRERATVIWRNKDPLVHEYVSSLPTRTPDEWESGFEESHVAEWYRVLMAAHIRPARGFRSPAAVKDRLPDLGWLPADARRLAWGRELATLAESYADPGAAAALALVLPLGNKGWLSQDDIADFLHRLTHMDPRRFRGHKNLIPLVEEVYGALSASASVPDRVLLLSPS